MRMERVLFWQPEFPGIGRGKTVEMKDENRFGRIAVWFGPIEDGNFCRCMQEIGIE